MLQAEPIKLIQVCFRFWRTVIGRDLAAGEIAGAAWRPGRLVHAGPGNRYVILGSGHEMSMLTTGAAFNSADGKHIDQMITVKG
ncbi:MAG: hypothetical protein HOK30_09465 [Rhodospirillaceae bacterium]|nr:hypothetical protein [Rhodospirillaceae bacterium]MBT5194756.1 hypothetical protein [Rhodospirillaceae bacterium]MBT6427876.1 hypothetical protein [Rhodospirillaceae bacterium]